MLCGEWKAGGPWVPGSPVGLVLSSFCLLSDSPRGTQEGTKHHRHGTPSLSPLQGLVDRVPRSSAFPHPPLTPDPKPLPGMPGRQEARGVHVGGGCAAPPPLHSGSISHEHWLSAWRLPLARGLTSETWTSVTWPEKCPLPASPQAMVWVHVPPPLGPHLCTPRRAPAQGDTPPPWVHISL